MPREITAQVSKYQRNRRHSSCFTRGEVFTLTANFKSVLGSATISSANWYVLNTSNLTLTAPAISGGNVSATVTALYSPGSSVKCRANLSDGRKVMQVFCVGVEDSPAFSDTATVSA